MATAAAVRPEASARASLHLHKLSREQTLLLFPDLRPDGEDARRECRTSRSGRHERVDLSGLRYQPGPPFCAWCGQGLGAAEA